MTVDLMVEDDRWTALDLAALTEAAANATLSHLCLSPGDFEIGLLACDDARIAVLNTEFRGKPVPTNVLSWPSAERSAAAEGAAPALPVPGPGSGPVHGPDTELGDIAIAYDTCAREAAEAGKPLPDHVTHLVVHAVLHLLGYDHVRDLDATLMEGIETAILGKMGLADPYSEEHGV